jgi:hypothetical protein
MSYPEKLQPGIDRSGKVIKVLKALGNRVLRIDGDQFNDVAGLAAASNDHDS